MFDIITIFLVGILLLFAVYTAIQFRGKFPKRTIEDVTPFLRPAEQDELESLLDPAQEANFRMRMSPQEFADWQRRRIHLMREYLLRMSHNALVLIEWGNMEALEARKRCGEMRQEAAAGAGIGAGSHRVQAVFRAGTGQVKVVAGPAFSL